MDTCKTERWRGEREEPVCLPKGGCNHVFCMEMPFAEGRAAASVKGERRRNIFAKEQIFSTTVTNHWKRMPCLSLPTLLIPLDKHMLDLG